MPQTKNSQQFRMLSPKFALTCSLQLLKDFIIGDNRGNLVWHRQHHANVIIHQYADSAVSALAFLSKSKQYVSAHTDGCLRSRNYEDGFKREIKIGYIADYLAELSNGLLLIKGKQGAFDVYDTKKGERLWREDVAEKFLARIPNTDDFIFKHPEGSLFVMQMTDKGFILKRSISFSQHDKIQSLHMLSQTVGILVKSAEIALCKLSEKSFTQFSTAQLQGPFIDFHLLSSSAEELTSRVDALWVTSRDARVINLMHLFPNLLKHIEVTELLVHDTKEDALQFSHHAGASSLLSKSGLSAQSDQEQTVAPQLIKSKL